MNAQTDQILSNAGLNKNRKFYLDNIRVFISIHANVCIQFVKKLVYVGSFSDCRVNNDV